LVLGTAGITRPAEPVEDAVGVHADAALGKALDYIRRHHADTLSNQTLAAMTGRSVRALERLFVRELGLTPQQYLRRVRVRLSCHDLINTRWGLREVALRHGFYDQSHFSREFRKETSMTPKAYRLQFGSSGIVLGSKGVPL
jgi:transcriptional regulator GlxA family with amidase domain